MVLFFAEFKVPKSPLNQEETVMGNSTVTRPGSMRRATLEMEAEYRSAARNRDKSALQNLLKTYPHVCWGRAQSDLAETDRGWANTTTASFLAANSSRGDGGEVLF